MAGKITIYAEQLYPLSYTQIGSSEGYVLGYATEFIRVLMDESGVAYDLLMVPWARALQTIDNQENVLIYSMARTPAREEDYLWLGELWPMRNFLYGLRSKQANLPTNLDEARSYRVGVTRGDVVHTYLKSKKFSRIVEVANLKKNFSLLKRDRIDLISFPDFALGHSATARGFDLRDLVVMLEMEEMSLVLSIAVSKTTDPELVRRLRLAYQSLRADGSYAQIMRPLRQLTEQVVVSQP